MSRVPTTIILAGLTLVAAALGGLRVLGWGKRWRDRAAADRQREEYESRDWLDTSAQHPQRPGTETTATRAGRGHAWTTLCRGLQTCSVVNALGLTAASDDSGETEVRTEEPKKTENQSDVPGPGGVRG